jgi:hypothetical protein
VRHVAFAMVIPTLVAIGAVALLAPSAHGTSAESGVRRTNLERSYGGSVYQTVCKPTTRPVLPDAGPLRGPLTRVVVHYTLKNGDVDALSLQGRRDSDRNGVPDYVECVEAAASAALETYERWGFRTPRPDHAGGDARPDIYLVANPGKGGDAYGKMLHDDNNEPFVEISRRLEPLEPAEYLKVSRNVFQGVWFTTAHELFHVVQNAYLSTDAIPAWIKEATASTWMMLGTATASQELVNHIDGWLKESHLSMSGQHGSCDQCYGSVLYWLYFHFPPGLQTVGKLPAPGGPTGTMFELLAARKASGKPIGLGSWAAEQAFRRWYPTLYPKSGLFPLFIDLMYSISAPLPGSRTAWPAYPDPLPRASTTLTKKKVELIYTLSAARIPIKIPKPLANRVLEVKLVVDRGVYAFLAVGGRNGIRQETNGRITIWRVTSSLAGDTCRLQGTPTQLKYLQWNDVSTAKPDDPIVNCAAGAVDLVVANTSTTSKRSLTISYRVLQPAVEVAGLDRSGDAPRGAPDLRSIDVKPSKARLTWTISATGATLTTAHVQFYLDTDLNKATGVEGGADYLYDYDGPKRTWALYKLVGASWSSLGSGAANVSEGEPFPLDVWISPTALGDPLRLRFKVRAWNGQDVGAADTAPSTGGYWLATTWKGYWTH